MWCWLFLSDQQKQNEGFQVLSAQPFPTTNNHSAEDQSRNQLNYPQNPQNIPLVISLNHTVTTQMLTLSAVRNGLEFSMNPERLPKQKNPQSQNTIKPISSKKKNIKKIETKIITQSSDSRVQSGRNPGRNSTSNIFRVFIKLCSKSKFETILNQKFKRISIINSFFISFQYFKLRIKELGPSTSNYINVKEFKKACEGVDEFSKTFRCLFHWFLNNYAINHSLTLKGKHRMMKESIKCFLKNLHHIESQLWKSQDKQIENMDEESFSKLSTD